MRPAQQRYTYSSEEDTAPLIYIIYSHKITLHQGTSGPAGIRISHSTTVNIRFLKAGRYARRYDKVTQIGDWRCASSRLWEDHFYVIMGLHMDVLSFHLFLETGNNRVCRGGQSPSPADITAIKQADAVILPPYCKESLYQTACDHCAHVFPNYRQRYRYPGKTGQTALFQDMKVPHPKTQIYRDIRSWNNSKDRQFDFPFVFKLNWGGEGNNVHLIHTEEELTDCLIKAEVWEKEQNEAGFVLQQYIPTGGQSLRVVVINKKYFSYWRRGPKGGDSFYSNIARGASIDLESDPHLQHAAVSTLKKFCQQSKINLAGFDFIFAKDDVDNTPYFLEINYCFRSKGLGGPGVYQQLLGQGVREWLTTIGALP